MTQDMPDKTRPDARAWPDIAGRIEGTRHVLPVRVYFEDTDFSGLVYHANFIKFIERGRSDFIRLLGIHHAELLSGTSDAAQEPAVFVVRHMELDYLRPAHIDDVLEVVTELGKIGSASLTILQKIERGGREIFRATVTVVLVSKSGKPQRIDAAMRPVLEKLTTA